MTRSRSSRSSSSSSDISAWLSVKTMDFVDIRFESSQQFSRSRCGTFDASVVLYLKHVVRNVGPTRSRKGE